MQERAKPRERVLREISPDDRAAADEIASMLDDALAMTPWERILANDDMVNFGDSLRAGMEARNAKSR